MRKVEVYPDRDTLMRAAAELFVSAAQKAIEANGQFAVALSGGSTPRRLYELLATEPFRSTVNWSDVHVFWGDERAVPPDHEASNFRMAAVSLLYRVPLPSQNVHRIRAELPPDQAAADYERMVRNFFALKGEADVAGQARASFDLVLLGMGSDGHTASLFPGAAAVHERDRWVVASYIASLKAWRITLTPPAFNAARQALFLAPGRDKAKALWQTLDGPYQPDALPAQVICPNDGDVVWMLDAEASLLR